LSAPGQRNGRYRVAAVPLAALSPEPALSEDRRAATGALKTPNYCTDFGPKKRQNSVLGYKTDEAEWS
jgi:hypothetical protein